MRVMAYLVAALSALAAPAPAVADALLGPWRLVAKTDPIDDSVFAYARSSAADGSSLLYVCSPANGQRNMYFSVQPPEKKFVLLPRQGPYLVITRVDRGRVGDYGASFVKGTGFPFFLSMTLRQEIENGQVMHVSIRQGTVKHWDFSAKVGKAAEAFAWVESTCRS
jgi:hypothetical protein